MEIDLESVSSVFELIFSLPLPALELTLDTLAIPAHLLLTNSFLHGLLEQQHSDTLKICIICWKLSGGSVFPRQYQIKQRWPHWRVATALLTLEQATGRHCV